MFTNSTLPASLIDATDKILRDEPLLACEACGNTGECQHRLMEDGVNDAGIPSIDVPNDIESDNVEENPQPEPPEELSGEKTEVEVNPEMVPAAPSRLRQ